MSRMRDGWLKAGMLGLVVVAAVGLAGAQVPATRVAGTQAAAAQQLTVTTERPSAVYATGETVRWKVELKKPMDAANPPKEISYTLKSNGLTTIQSGKLALTDNVATLEYTPDSPVALLAIFTTPGPESKPTTASGGAIVSPEKFKPSAARPEDFDAFWEKQIAELKKVDFNAKLTPVDLKKPGVSYWKITLDNVRGTHIQGQLARPEKGEKFPALLVVQYAGVYPLAKEWATDWAGRGWLTLNIQAHDIPIDEPKEFYAEQSKGALNDYSGINNDDREKTYFNRMYLSCYQAAEYLSTRPDWDGKVLVVMGGSQGGLQALVAAAIHPKITGALAGVPAGCDMTGPQAGRDPGWPKWALKTAGKDAKKVVEASRYYDVVNFASRIKCPVLIGAGIIDTTCPPAGVLAAYNEIPSATKEIVLMPGADHKGPHGAYYGRLGAWMTDLKAGKTPAVREMKK